MMSVLHPGNKQVRNVMYVLNKVIIRQCGLLVGETVSFSTSCFMFAFSFFRFFGRATPSAASAASACPAAS